MKNLLTTLVFLIFVRVTFAQDPTLMPTTQAGQTGLSLVGGSLANSVALGTGEVTFPFSLVSQTAPGGIPINVSISYNSNVEYAAKRINEDAPTGVVGLGWSFGYPQITVNNKMTGTRHDDTFYANGQELICFDNNVDNYLTANGGSENDVWAFQTKGYSPYTYYYIEDEERWEVKIEGMTYVYGGKNEFSSSIQWLVHWGNWIGDSKNISGQNRQAIVWNLSYVEDQWDQWVEYEYTNIEEQVGVGGQYHTEASYLSKISQSDGAYILFFYTEKNPDEYVEPHQESSEPDAYQERYQTKYLDSVKSYGKTNQLQRTIHLTYSLTNLFGTPPSGLIAANFEKRMLNSVYYENKEGHVSTPTSFHYLLSDDTAGKIDQVTSPSGERTYYTYTAKTGTLSALNLEKTIYAPSSGYSRPKVWSTGNYTVVGWKNASSADAKFYVYWWDGEWKEKYVGDLYNSSSTNDFYDNDMHVWDVQMQLQGDHFAILRDNSGSNGSNYIRCWVNDKTGEWETSGNVHVSHVASNTLRLVSGDKYFGYINRGTGGGTLSVFYRDDLGWNTYTDVVPGGTLYATGTNNYIVIHRRNTNPDQMWVYYLNELNDWIKTPNSTTGISTGFETNDNHGGSNWTSANAFPAVAPGDAGDEIRSFSWNEDYNNISYKIMSTQSNVNPVIFQISPSQGLAYHQVGQVGNGGAFSYKFDGVSWSWGGAFKPVSKAFSELGNTAIRHDHTNNSTTADIWIYNPQDHDWDMYTQSAGSSQARILSLQNGFFVHDDFYWSRPDLGNSHFGGNYDEVENQIDNPEEAKASGSDYVVSRSGGKIHLYQNKNGEFNPTDLGETYYTGGSVYEYGLVGPASFVTCNQPLLVNSTILKLHRVMDGQATGQVTDYPVTKIEIQDGYRSIYTSYDYGNGRSIAPNLVNYNLVSAYPSSQVASTSNNGRIDTYFFIGNVFGNNYGNENTYSIQLGGKIYRSVVYDATNTIIQDSKTGFNVLFDNEFIKIQKNKEVVTKDGVTTTANFTYNDKNQVISSSVTNHDSQGNADLITNENTYIWEQYGSYGTNTIGLFNPVIQTKKTVNSNLISSSATKWSGSKWAPYKSYVWDGGADDFTAFTNPTDPTGWLLTNTITERSTSSGNVYESLGLDGLYTSHVYNLDETLVNMSVSNAKSNEVYFADFNGGGNTSPYYNDATISDGILSTPSTGSRAAMFLDGNTMTSFRSDFRVRLGLGSGWAGFKFNNVGYTVGTNTGNTVRIYMNGNVQLYYGSTLKSSASYSGDMSQWHTVSVRRTTSEVKVYIDNEELLNFSGLSGASSDSNHGFYTYNQETHFDHLRYYPADAFASSTSYEEDTYQPFETMVESGLVTTNYFDSWGSQVATIDDQGVAMTTIAGASSLKYNINFNANDPSRVLSTIVGGGEGFSDDFREQKAKWDIVSPTGNSEWSVESGRLKSSFISSPSTNHGYYLDLGHELTGRVAIEFDVWGEYYSAGLTFGFAAGGDGWNFDASGSENAIWTSFNEDSYMNYYGSVWSTVGPSLDLDNKSHRIKIVADTDSDMANFYIDGKWIAQSPFNQITSGLQKFGFRNYANTYNVFYVDNFLIYQEGIQEVSYYDASGNTIQSVSKTPDGKYMANEPIVNSLGQTVGSGLPTAMTMSSPLQYQSDFITGFNESTGAITGSLATLSGSYAYSAVKLEKSPSGRALESGGFGSEYSAYSSNGNTTQHFNTKNSSVTSSPYYMGTEYPSGNYRVTETTSPEGAKQISFYDKIGNLVMTKVGVADVDGQIISNQQVVLSSSVTSATMTVTHDQIVNYATINFINILEEEVELKIGTSLGASDVIYYSGTASTSGTFSAQQGVTYYISISLTPSGGAFIDYVDIFLAEYQTYLTTKYEYDDDGNLVNIYHPNYFDPPVGSVPGDFVTEMQYDQLGRMTSKTTPDNGTIEYMYDDLGRVMFSRDAQATADNIVFYNKYDFWGRVEESGYCTNNWSTLSFDDIPSSPIWKVKTNYDSDGSIDKIENNNNTDTSAEAWEEYAYDRYDRVIEVKEYVYDYNNDNIPETTTYEYDNLGNITEEDYGNGFVVTYHYNKEDGSLKSIGTATDSDFFASYTYDTNGRMASEIIKDGSITRSFQYDDHGNLITIDHGSEYFKEDLLYESGGYNSYGNYSGMISKATFTFQGSNWGGGAPDNYSYLYSYDNLGRLLSADYSLVGADENDLGVGTGEHLRYDANGNLTYLKRGSDTYDYTYEGGTNKLQNTDGTSTSHYNYDANGNTVSSGPSNAIEDVSTALTVGVYNDVSYKLLTGGSVTLSPGFSFIASPSLSFEVSENPVAGDLSLNYDKYFNKTNSITRSIGETWETELQYGAMGERVLKYDHNAAETSWTKTRYTFGLNDFPIKATVKSNTTSDQTTYYVYGPTGLIATKLGTNHYYMLKDHQGSVRVVVDDTDDVASAYNYRPFGGMITSTLGEDSPYKFTGHEYDKETGLHNFRARMYDEETGRFYAYDPAEQFASPYTGLNNNYINIVDPDGEFGLFSHFQRVGRIFGDVANGDWGDLRRELTDYTIEGAIAVASFYTGGAVAGATSGTLGVTGSNIAGAVASGAVNGGGTAGHQSNWKPRAIARGAGIGALSGTAGVLVGDAFASQGLTGLGAFMGGATSSGLSAGLNGGSRGQIIGSAVFGGSLNYGMYHLSSRDMRNNTTRIDRKEIRRLHKKASASNFDREYKKIIGADNKQIDSSIEYYEGEKGSVPSKYLDRLGIKMLQKNYWLKSDYHSHPNDFGLSGFDGDLGVYLRYQEAYHFTKTFSVGPNQVHTFTGWNGNWNNPVGNQASWSINRHFFNPLFFY